MIKAYFRLPVLVFLTVIFQPLLLYSQIQYGGLPAGVAYEGDSTGVEVFKAELPEAMQYQQEHYDVSPGFGEALHAGFSLQVNRNISNSGTWFESQGSKKVWRLAIHTPGALASGLVFDYFNLPENSRMFVYSNDRKTILGGFDHRNNNKEKVFTTHIIPGDTIIIEYEENLSRGNLKNEHSKSPFNISDVIYITNGGGVLPGQTKGIGNSDFCQVNINCPEGFAWQRHKRSVARMLMRAGDNYYWCTGALVNNTAEDGTPYILSAAHCGEEASFEDLIYWHFYFNFERPGCEDKGTPPYNMLHGCELKSLGPLEGGSDFRLLKLGENPPPSWKPYYSGWTRSSSPSNSGVGIHHPSGDVKKISTYEETLSSATPTVSENRMAENSAWRVEWVRTDTHWGVPEGGSSGSPLFNSQGLVVGTLTGGSSNCSSPQYPDYYGKMSYHWESNDPENENRQLKPFLDPENTGALTLQGFDPYYEQYPPPGFFTANKTIDNHAELIWYKPGSSPNKQGWYSYITSFTHLTWETPERATLFDSEKLDFTFPVVLEKVAHSFGEHDEHQWPDNKFRFRIYNSDGAKLLYESDEITALNMQERVYELQEPLYLEEKFYVSVKPSHSSGHPSTLMHKVNYGSGNSFFGSEDNWTPYVDIANSQEFDFMTKIYVSSDKSQKVIEASTIDKEKENNKPHIIYMGNEENTSSDPHKYEPVIVNKESPVSYKLYRDNEMIHQTEDAEDLNYSYIDENIEHGFYRYHVTALYNNNHESESSNPVNILFEEPCGDFIDDFPHVEDFEGGELEDCWRIVDRSDGSWEFSTGYSVNNVEVSPVEGSHLIFVSPSDEEFRDEWLITKPVDLSSANSPALRFWFNGSYSESVIDNNYNLKVYVSVDDGAFHEIWNHKMHPEFNSVDADFTWFQALINLREYYGKENIRIAFHYEGLEGSYFAVDKIELLDASGMLSTITLSVDPSFSGMVTGGGAYLEGEPVTIKARPNIEYTFSEWKKDDEVFSKDNKYSFLMPPGNLNLTAKFTTVLSSDKNPVDPGLLAGYPNPAQNKYNVLFNKSMNDVTVDVYNLKGKIMKSNNYNFVEQGKIITINMDSFAAGIYLVKVRNDDYNRTLKVSIID